MIFRDLLFVLHLFIMLGFEDHIKLPTAADAPWLLTASFLRDSILVFRRHSCWEHVFTVAPGAVPATLYNSTITDMNSEAADRSSFYRIKTSSTLFIGIFESTSNSCTPRRSTSTTIYQMFSETSYAPTGRVAKGRKGRLPRTSAL